LKFQPAAVAIGGRPTRKEIVEMVDSPKQRLLQQLEGTVIALLGPPAAGKDDQHQRLNRWLGAAAETFPPGERLREEIRQKTAIGREAQGYVAAGQLVPDRIIDVLFGRFLKQTEAKIIVLNGFPRSLVQVEILVRRVNRWRLMLVKIEVSPAECFRRIFETDRDRHDDTPETVAERLRVYSRHEAEILDYFRRQALSVITVNGEQSRLNVQRDIVRGLRGQATFLASGETVA